MFNNGYSDKPNLLAGVPTRLLNGNTKTTTYDALGRVLTDSDFKGKFVTYEYDSLGRVTRQTTPLNGEVKSITEYEYDGRGNITEQRISNNPDNSAAVTFRITTNAYDSMGNLTDCTIYACDV